jgi:molybdate transport system substrate-binding protein
VKLARPGLGLLFALLLSLALIACSSDDNKSDRGSAVAGDAQPTATTKPVTGSITVFAAASLTDAFNEIGSAFKADNPGTSVTFQFGGSSGLRTQLEQGARADIFASADTVQMGLAKDKGIVGDDGRIFVQNSLVVITPSGGTPRVTKLADLGNSGIKLVLANASVPVGNYARQVFGNMETDPAYGAGFSDKVLANLVSEESDVKAVVAKVQLGEADAGVVYGTDVTASVAPQLKTIAIPTALNVVAQYPIAITEDAANVDLAQAFISYVLSAKGQSILKKYGFVTAS